MMCPQVLPRELYNECIDDVLNYVKPKIEKTPKYSYWITCLEDLKNRQTFEEKYPDWQEGLKAGKERLQKVDKWRKNEGIIEKIYSENPKVLKWWKKKAI